MISAAQDLDLVVQFFNTLDQRTFTRHGENHVTTDELTSPEALAAWLNAHGLSAPDTGLRRADLQAARALRSALRAALGDQTSTGSEPTDDGRAEDRSEKDGTKKNETEEDGTGQFPPAFAMRLIPDSSGRLRLSAASGVTGLDVIVETVATHIATGRWNRLKLCASTDCRWAFHDTSRSGGGRWCSMEICGNRHKTRAYRRRHAD